MEEISIDKLQMPSRTRNTLNRLGIFTIEQLMFTSVQTISEQKNVGLKTLDEIDRIINQLENGELNLMDFSETEDTNGERCVFTADQLLEMSSHFIDELELSKRSYNVLMREGLNSIDKVVVLSKHEIADLNGLGAASKNEILDHVFKWLDENEFMLAKVENSVELEIKLYFQRLEGLIRPIFHIHWKHLLEFSDAASLITRITFGGLDDINSDNLIAVFEIPEIQQKLKDFFLLNAPNAIISQEKFVAEIGRLNLEFNSNILLDKYFDGSIITVENEYCFINNVKIIDYIRRRPQCELTEKYDLLMMRVQGESLQAIGEKVGVTRERVRQILLKTVNKFPLLYEDIFSEPFRFFKMSKESFSAAFPSCGEVGYEYLSIRYKKGRLEFTEKNLQDYTGVFNERLKLYFQEEVDKYDRQTVTRTEMIYRVLISNGDKPLTFKDFEVEYYNYIEKKGFPRERLELNMRTVANHLRNAKHVVFNREGCLRYCQADEKIIWEYIDFFRYKNLVISAELIYDDYKALMDEIDIQDGYELFYIIKASLENWNSDEFDIYCRRIPVIVLGDGCEEKQAIQLLKEISPISYYEYYKAYEERYGLKKESAQGNVNITGTLIPYYADGQYSIDVPAIDSRDVEPFKLELAQKALWFIEELEAVFAKVCVHSSFDALNRAAFARIGYTLNTGYAYNSVYGTVGDFFDAKVFSSDLVELSKLDQRMVNLPSFFSFLDKKKKSLEYIEIAPKLLLSMRCIEEEYGISKSEIHAFQNNIKSICKDRYFNAHSIWSQIEDNITVKKMQGNEWLCTCAMRQQEGIFSLLVGGNIVLSKDSIGLSLNKICEWIVDNNGKMSVHELTDTFNILFDSNVAYYKIAEKIKSSNMWEQLVTDSLDNYIENLVDLTDMSVNSLLQEEFF